MIREALADTLGHLKNYPLLWAGGLIAALITLLDLLIAGTDTVLAGRFQILAFLVFPFIIAGSYGIIREKEGSLALYAQYGMEYYFRVLLPLLIILFAVLLTILLVLFSISIVGIAPTADLAFFLGMGVSVPILLLTYFYDAFAVFRDEKIFDSIRASITMVLAYSWKILLFVAVNIAVLGSLLFGLAFVWAGLLWESMSEIAEMDPEIISAMTGDEVMAMLGPDALFATAVVLFIWATIATPFTIAFKAAFFQRLEQAPRVEQQVGVYDEKGRWYKY
ncbi:MAG: hypothetical protein D5R99_08520 [Methanocalculus sp. MSAO_Arc1]|uniref:DUF7847 domain-containing protein n=1 Tax=Methanocalculus TaxID=71151 RepID=UPI000FF1BBE4|nr:MULTISPECIES: hypothetical protein [unclassified Methanocalculus]MCP1663144.1 hypothetical protein [Methanocalculus sp. AMF5]RQD79353.1 MAG: hypothetical protein D5R99_08520 [Methanocalculus sp. MSAO_Arc1]